LSTDCEVDGNSVHEYSVDEYSVDEYSVHEQRVDEYSARQDNTGQYESIARGCCVAVPSIGRLG
jgi:hypothetical protein